MAEERRNYGIEVRGGSKKASNVPSHKESTVYVRSLSSAGSTSPQASKPRSWLGVVSIGDLVSKDLDRSGCSAGVGDGRLPARSLRCLPTLFSADLHKALQPENGFTGPCALLPIHSVIYTIPLSRSTSMEPDPRSVFQCGTKGKPPLLWRRGSMTWANPPRKQAPTVSLCAGSRLPGDPVYCAQEDWPAQNDLCLTPTSGRTNTR